jgi:hypothetical protein
MKNREILAVFDSDEKLVKALQSLQRKGVPVKEAYTPFPVHDVLKILGRESRLPFFSIMAGVGTIVLVFAFLYYTSVIDYPINYGGKPYFAFPSFVVIIYLLTILFTFAGTVLAFHVRTGLFPGKEAESVFSGSADDKFILTIGGEGDLTDDMASLADSILKENGAVEINENPA